MSNAFEIPSYADEHSSYPPKRAREAARSGRNSLNSPSARDEYRNRDTLPRPDVSVSFLGDRVESGRFRSESAEQLQPPSDALAQPNSLAYVRLLWPAIAVALASALAIFAFAALTSTPKSDSYRASEDRRSTSPQAPGKKIQEAQTRAAAPPKLVVERLVEQQPGANARLDVAVSDSRDGGLVVISGLASGAILSAGHKVDDNSWWLSFADLDNLEVRPPPKFLGAMDIEVELRLADTSLSDRVTRHIEWVDKAPEAKPARAPAAGADDQADLLGALRHGQELIAQGNLEAARQLVRRAADPANAAGPSTPPRDGAGAQEVRAQEARAQEARADEGAALQSESEKESTSKTQNEGVAKASGSVAEEYRARCFVKVDGRVHFDGRCQISWKSDSSVTFALEHDPLTLTHGHGRTWLMALGERELGKVFKRGSCWGSRRVYVCERNG
ncbi:MAG TPA: hypothetical protein VED87_08230 [Methylocystis sp.]|nr:hypothetical protein [Methylocystis sp.]